MLLLVCFSAVPFDAVQLSGALILTGSGNICFNRFFLFVFFIYLNRELLQKDSKDENSSYINQHTNAWLKYAAVAKSTAR